jgi:hypothetical protein
MRAAGVTFEVMQPNNPEYSIIYQYALNTYTDQNRKQIRNIIKLQKEKD